MTEMNRDLFKFIITASTQALDKFVDSKRGRIRPDEAETIFCGFAFRGYDKLCEVFITKIELPIKIQYYEYARTDLAKQLVLNNAEGYCWADQELYSQLNLCRFGTVDEITRHINMSTVRVTSQMVRAAMDNTDAAFDAVLERTRFDHDALDALLSELVVRGDTAKAVLFFKRFRPQLSDVSVEMKKRTDTIGCLIDAGMFYSYKVAILLDNPDKLAYNPADHEHYCDRALSFLSINVLKLLLEKQPELTAQLIAERFHDYFASDEVDEAETLIDLIIEYNLVEYVDTYEYVSEKRRRYLDIIALKPDSDNQSSFIELSRLFLTSRDRRAVTLMLGGLDLFEPYTDSDVQFLIDCGADIHELMALGHYAAVSNLVENTNNTRQMLKRSTQFKKIRSDDLVNHIVQFVTRVPQKI